MINNTMLLQNKAAIYIKKYWFVYLLVIPGIIHNFIFRYVPIYGILIAFKEYKISKGILGSPWVGLKNFEEIFQNPYFYKVLWNTIIINIYNIVFGFTFIILLALLLNEIRFGILKKIIQTFVYLPNFLSWVIFSGLIMTILSPSDGPINILIQNAGGDPVYFLGKPQYFRAILIISGIVKSSGFATIIYLAAIAGINPEMYDCAILDGAHRGHIIWHITLPRIMPTIAVLLILNVANLFNSNFDQVFTLYSPLVWDTGDVISTYLYRAGLLEGRFEMGTALGLIFNVISLTLVVLTNKVIQKMDVTGIF